ncbi:hypothetical protein [Thiosocius teredinicola]|uniref:hypothetical protein n=1 Tax=Thiosocius teredinicola TaxID=1973002 RepID=UPI000F790CFD
MNALYRKPIALPSLLPGLILTLALGACDSQPPPEQAAKEPVPNQYLEAIQEAEALKHTIEERNLQEKQIDELLGKGQSER